jgi:molybdopterin synthase catalytic subunit
VDRHPSRHSRVRCYGWCIVAVRVAIRGGVVPSTMKGMPRHDHAVFGEMHDLIDLRHSPIDVAELYNWAVIESCGAVVVFSGTVRDHADGRSNVTSLTYEAYEEPARSRMAEIVAEMRRRWPDLGRIAMVHRLGQLDLGDSAVVVVVSAPHRPAAFEAARFAIDTLKDSVPIWKHESWADGSDWGTNARPIGDVPSEATR